MQETINLLIKSLQAFEITETWNMFSLNRDNMPIIPNTAAEFQF